MNIQVIATILFFVLIIAVAIQGTISERKLKNKNKSDLSMPLKQWPKDLTIPKYEDVKIFLPVEYYEKYKDLLETIGFSKNVKHPPKRHIYKCRRLK